MCVCVWHAMKSQKAILKRNSIGVRYVSNMYHVPNKLTHFIFDLLFDVSNVDHMDAALHHVTRHKHDTTIPAYPHGPVIHNPIDRSCVTC